MCVPGTYVLDRCRSRNNRKFLKQLLVTAPCCGLLNEVQKTRILTWNHTRNQHGNDFCIDSCPGFHANGYLNHKEARIQKKMPHRVGSEPIVYELVSRSQGHKQNHMAHLLQRHAPPVPFSGLTSFFFHVQHGHPDHPANLHASHDKSVWNWFCPCCLNLSLRCNSAVRGRRDK